MSETAKKVIMTLVAVFIMATILVVVWRYFSPDIDKILTGFQGEVYKSTGVDTSKTPQEILDNKFGFLSGGSDDIDFIKNTTAKWVRPHPGPFLWDAMQKSNESEIDFSKTDELVKSYQKNNLGILITLWPFADWDQENSKDLQNCKVSQNDEFLSKGFLKGDNTYLPVYRCNPNDWEKYTKWVKVVIERYDGDGLDDMPDLLYPIKYWEVLNEPDLNDIDERLDFYKQGPDEYAVLLEKTYKAIKEVDKDAKILIAGAAGGNEEFLSFYKNLFNNYKKITSYFDIGNIHCISNDDFESFNVTPYKAMFDEFNIDKPIWVTEAEALVYNNDVANATQTDISTKNAIKNGAQKLFYTSYNFQSKEIKPLGPAYDAIANNLDFKDKSADKIYKIIFNKYE